MLRTDRLEYDLPDRLIATRPADRRDEARLLVVSRADPARLEHRRVRDLPALLEPGDALVRNATRVLPARLLGRRADTGGRVEGLFLEADPADPARWTVMLRSNGRLRPSTTVELMRAGEPAGVSLVLETKRDGGSWTVRARGGLASLSETLDRVGATPLPPYILQARRARGEDVDDEDDRDRYQTVFASADSADARGGSVTAPTAGLHLTPELADRLRERAVASHDVDLHVGAGTFRPIESEHVERHAMHVERFSVPGATLRAIDEARRAGARSVVVGTTSARALESVPFPTPTEALERGWAGETGILITPGYEWKRVDALLTNFHLPRSTLLAMVAALLPEGAERLLEVYRVAIESEYRFYSYGDAMLVLP